MNPVFEEAPGTVYNLRATFSLKFATSLGILVCGHADIGGQFPHPLALDFDTLFAVSDMVVQNPAHFGFVRLGCICVKNDDAVPQVLGRKRLPLNLADCAWSRRSPGRCLRSQPLQDQRMWSTSLHDAAPLLPNDRLRGVLGHFLQVCVAECGLICFHISPGLGVAEEDGFLLLLDPTFAKMAQPVLHVLNGLVVDVKNAMDGRVRDAIEQQEQQSRLCLQRSGTSTSCILEDWM